MNERELFIWVNHRAVPQGDLRIAIGGGKRRLYHSVGKRLKPYRQTVAWKAKLAMQTHQWWMLPADQHCEVRATFFFKDGLNRGDGDKLMRALLDALTGIVYEDDKQVSKGGWDIQALGRRYACECVEITVRAA